MKKTNIFQIITMTIMIFIAIAAVIAFSVAKPSKGGAGITQSYGEVKIWGTIPETQRLGTILSSLNKQYEGHFDVTYKGILPDDFDRALLEALADGIGPDLLILPNEWLNRNIPRIYPIPYEVEKGGVTGREFLDAFTEAGEIYLRPEGILALPLLIDPLVMYWNRDLFTNASIANPPKYWDEFLKITPLLTNRRNLEITQSAVGLGEFVNVTNAKDILSLFFLQVDNPIVEVAPDGTPTVLLDNQSPQDSEAALRFFTDFANPLKTIYTWNRSFTSSKDAFLSGSLAVYFDLASEYPNLVQKNPRLNIDLAAVPQTRGRTREVTFGKLHGVTVLKSSKKIAGAIVVAKLITGETYGPLIANAAELAPVRRDALSRVQTDAFRAIFYDSALKAKSWLDPEPNKSHEIFSRMVDGVTSGRKTVREAIRDAGSEFSAAFE